VRGECERNYNTMSATSECHGEQSVGGSGFSQALVAVTKRVVDFVAHQVCREDLLELLQGAVDSTATR